MTSQTAEINRYLDSWGSAPLFVAWYPAIQNSEITESTNFEELGKQAYAWYLDRGCSEEDAAAMSAICEAYAKLRLWPESQSAVDWVTEIAFQAVRTAEALLPKPKEAA